MRLIDADAFDRALADAEFTAALNEAADQDSPFEQKTMYYSTQSFRDVMAYRPTVDAMPVIHAQWVKMTGMMIPELHGYHECSNCGYFEDYHNREHLTPYCPHCGAKMDNPQEKHVYRKKESV